MTRLFHPIDYARSAELQQQAIKWLADNDLVHSEYRNTVTVLDVNELVKNIPLINDFLTSINRQLADAALHRVINTFNFGITDTIHLPRSPSHQNKKRTFIEIPVIGCEHSERVFYHAKVTGLQETVNGLKYWSCDESTAVELNRIRVTQPTVLDISVPTKIELTRTFVNRMSIVLRVTPDTMDLLY